MAGDAPSPLATKPATLHGLCEPNPANGAAGIYIWWLVLYMVLVPFWTRLGDESTLLVQMGELTEVD